MRAPAAGADATLRERLAQGKTRWVPGSQPLQATVGVRAIVTVHRKKPALHACRSGMARDGAQCVERTSGVLQRKPRAVIVLLPEVAGAMEYLVETHGRVPIEPVYKAGQSGGLGRFEKVVDVVAHEAQYVELEAVLPSAAESGPILEVKTVKKKAKHHPETAEDVILLEDLVPREEVTGGAGKRTFRAGGEVFEPAHPRPEVNRDRQRPSTVSHARTHKKGGAMRP